MASAEAAAATRYRRLATRDDARRPSYRTAGGDHLLRDGAMYSRDVPRLAFDKRRQHHGAIPSPPGFIRRRRYCECVAADTQILHSAERRIIGLRSLADPRHPASVMAPNAFGLRGGARVGHVRSRANHTQVIP